MHKLWRSSAECLVASVSLILLTVVFYRLHLNLATASLLYVIVIVLLSRVGSFVSSIVTSTVAALCLAHLVSPAYSFRVYDPLDDVAIAAFLVTSFIIASLVSRVRKQAEEGLASVSYKVIEAEETERQRIARDLHEGIGQRVTLLVIEIEQLKAGSLNGVRNFDVQLGGKPNEIHLTVSDRGVGFNLETARKAAGLGINHMEERLKLVKGTLSIDSQPKRGTTIHARVPLRLGSDSMGAAE
jgi:signal transduction histidine kinase